jgi:peptide chain release factor 1
MLDDKLSGIRLRFEEITHLLSQPETLSDSARFQKLTREHSELTELVRAYDALCALRTQLQENEALASDSSEDPELRELASQEIPALREQLESIEWDIKKQLLPKDPDDQRNAILEIRAGTGGDEAALFARDLFRMYGKLAEARRWKISLLSAHENDLGGFKEVTAAIEGQDVFSQLKFEAGVHRVQRVPKTETQGRIHTSAATVAIMPEVEDVDVEIDHSDLRVDVYRASGAGGQHVNTTDSAVRITHVPTGMVVACQNERSQIKNRAQALKILRARLYEAQVEAQQQATSEQRRSMVGSGDRSERIRTYNFPQGRITDHRINLTVYKLEEVLMGQLDLLIDPLLQHHQAELLRQGGLSE